MTTDAQRSAAGSFLFHKLHDIIGQCSVPALAAVLVRDDGDTLISAQRGVRKFGESPRGFGGETLEDVEPWDRFCLGSISKVYTAHLIGALMEAGVNGIDWNTKLGDVFPPGSPTSPYYKTYADLSMDYYTVHSTGMGWQPDAEIPIEYDWVQFTPADDTFDRRHARRLLYVQHAIEDKPQFPPGTGFQYGGGGIINACILETQTNQLYEDLVHTYLYAPLGMTESGFGRLCSENVLNGPWQHTFDQKSRTLVADKETMVFGYDLNPRSCVGSACSSARDLATFLAEELRASPVLFKTQRSTMQSFTPAPLVQADQYRRGGWALVAPGQLYHDGDNGRSRAEAVVFLKTGMNKGMAYAAMSNVENTIAAPAISDAENVAVAIDTHFDDIFGKSAWPIDFDLTHSCPAVTCTDAGTVTLFARRHDGTIHVRQSTDHGNNWNASSQIHPDWIFTSGLAAATAANGQIYVTGRGTDNQIWYAKSAPGGTNWSGAWPIPMGLFETGPAIGADATGTVLHVVAVGTDHKMYIGRSLSGGASWMDNGKAIGNGLFTSNPAIAVSGDGQFVHVFARGTDYRIWYNKSTNMGTDFQPHWTPIGEGLFSSGPAAACSADGDRLYVAGRGLDRSLWANASGDGGASFEKHWKQKKNITFIGGPALASDNAGAEIYVSVIGGDMTLYSGRSDINGPSLSGAHLVDQLAQVSPTPQYFI